MRRSTRDPGRWIEIRLADFFAAELHEPGGPAAQAALDQLTRGRTLTCIAVHGRGGGGVSYDRLIATRRIGRDSLGHLLRRSGIGEGGRGR